MGCERKVKCWGRRSGMFEGDREGMVQRCFRWMRLGQSGSGDPAESPVHELATASCIPAARSQGCWLSWQPGAVLRCSSTGYATTLTLTLLVPMGCIAYQTTPRVVSASSLWQWFVHGGDGSVSASCIGRGTKLHKAEVMAHQMCLLGPIWCALPRTATQGSAAMAQPHPCWYSRKGSMPTAT